MNEPKCAICFQPESNLDHAIDHHFVNPMKHAFVSPSEPEFGPNTFKGYDGETYSLHTSTGAEAVAPEASKAVASEPEVGPLCRICGECEKAYHHDMSKWVHTGFHRFEPAEAVAPEPKHTFHNRVNCSNICTSEECPCVCHEQFRKRVAPEPKPEPPNMKAAIFNSKCYTGATYAEVARKIAQEYCQAAPASQPGEAPMSADEFFPKWNLEHTEVFRGQAKSGWECRFAEAYAQLRVASLACFAG